MGRVFIGALILILLLIAYAVWTPGSGGSPFTPVPVGPCAPAAVDSYFIDATDRTGTVVRDPYPPSPGTGDPLARFTSRSRGPAPAPAPSCAAPGPALSPAWSSGEPVGDALERAEDRTLSLLAAVARRSPPGIVGGRSSAADLGDIDTDFVSDGVYEPAVMKEALTSRRPPRANPLTAARVGLGSVRMDPRFEPGPESRLNDGDTSPAPGSHAGGPTLGAYGSSRYQNKGGWGTNYVRGFGDPDTYPPESIITGISDW